MAEAEPFDASDQKQSDARVNRAKVRELRRLGAIKAFLSTVEGRAALYTWLAACGVYQSPFAMNALAMAHTVGKGDVGRQILGDLIAADEGFYLQMLKEQKEDFNG